MSHKTKPHGNKPTPQPKNPSSEKESTNRHVYIEPGVKVDLVDDLKKQYKTTQGENTAHQDKQIFWTKIAALLLLIYTLLTGGQAWWMRKSVVNTQENFAVQERAWVSINVDPTIPPQNDVQIFWPLHINNVGKTFAKNIEGDFFATVLSKGESPQFDYSIGHPHHRLYVGGIFPNEPLPTTSVRVVKYGPHAPEPILMTQQLRQAIANNETAIIVYGKLTYDDIFGVHHWTTFCNGTGDALQLDNIKKCITYNNADSNK